MLTAQQIIETLKLEPHPEGGFYRRVYRCEESFPQNTLPPRYQGARPFSTAIYYLLTPQTFSRLHKLKSDELFHFYLGDAVQMLQLWPDGKGGTVTLGHQIPEQQPLHMVPRGVWQGSRLLPGGQYALLGTTVAPGFEFADYQEDSRAELIRRYPDFHELITALTPAS